MENIFSSPDPIEYRIQYSETHTYDDYNNCRCWTEPNWDPEVFLWADSIEELYEKAAKKYSEWKLMVDERVENPHPFEKPTHKDFEIEFGDIYIVAAEFSMTKLEATATFQNMEVDRIAKIEEKRVFEKQEKVRLAAEKAAKLEELERAQLAILAAKYKLGQ